MPRIQLSFPVQNISGTIPGPHAQTYYVSHGMQYSRKPGNGQPPHPEIRNHWLSVYNLVSDRWFAMTITQRVNWENYATARQPDRPKGTPERDGRYWYCHINFYRFLYNDTTSTTPPPYPSQMPGPVEISEVTIDTLAGVTSIHGTFKSGSLLPWWTPSIPMYSPSRRPRRWQYTPQLGMRAELRPIDSDSLVGENTWLLTWPPRADWPADAYIWFRLTPINNYFERWPDRFFGPFLPVII